MDKEQILRQVKLFESIDSKHLRGIANISLERTFKNGEYLMKQDDSGIGLFILISGKVQIEKIDGSGKMVVIAENTAGDILGEMAVLDGSPRSASVKAITDTVCLVLASWEFNAFMKSHPEVALEILPVIVKRFRETNDVLTSLRM